MLSTLLASIFLGATLLGFILAVLIVSRSKLKNVLAVDEDFISARRSQSWYSIGLSLFAGGMGTWTLTAPPENAVQSGCWALIGYAIAIVVPWILFIWIGPALRRLMGERGFTALEFVEERFGRPMQLIVALGALVTMWVFLVAELTAIGTCLESLSPDFPGIAATVSVAVVTTLYTAFGGLRASLLTDRIQGAMILLLVVACYTAVFTTVEPHIESDTWSQGFSWESEGIVAGLTLIVSCIFVEILNQATWQRVFASKNDIHLRGGFILGVCLSFTAMIVFGLAGNFAKAAHISNYITMPPGEEYNALFLLLSSLPSVWLVFTVIMATGLVASSVDSLQTGISAMIASDLIKRGKSLNWARFVCILLNVPAVIVASYNPPSILELLTAGNVVSTAIGPAVFLGFSSKITSNGAIGGVISGLLSVYCMGWWRVGPVEGLTWFRFPHGYNWECLLTFIVETIVAIMFSFFFSYLEYRFRPHVYLGQQKRFTAMKEKMNQEETNQTHYANNDLTMMDKFNSEIS